MATIAHTLWQEDEGNSVPTHYGGSTQLRLEMIWVDRLLPYMQFLSLMTTSQMPSGEKQSGEQSQIYWAYYPKAVEDQWDCEIANYYIALPLQQ